MYMYILTENKNIIYIMIVIQIYILGFSSNINDITIMKVILN